jgi:hypothetical protein
LARNVAFIANLMESGVAFNATCRTPSRLSSKSVHHWPKKKPGWLANAPAALAAAKARGTKLGGYRGGPVVNYRKANEARVNAADDFAAEIAATITPGMSLAVITSKLTADGIRKGHAPSRLQCAAFARPSRVFCGL